MILTRPLLSVGLIAGSLCTAGCQSAGSPKPRLSEDKMGRHVRTLATTAESRVVIVKQQEDTNGLTKAMILAEPSPDVAARLSSLLDLTAKASADIAGKGKGEATLALVSKATRDIARLSARSQGVILFRDGAFQLAQGYINGAVTEGEFRSQLDTMFQKAAEVVTKELESNPSLSALPPELPMVAPEESDSRAEILGKLVAAYWSDEANVKTDFDLAAKGVLNNAFLKAASGAPRQPTPAEAERLLAKLREMAKADGKDALRTVLKTQFGPSDDA
jgi:hypothetical protein